MFRNQVVFGIGKFDACRHYLETWFEHVELGKIVFEGLGWHLNPLARQAFKGPHDNFYWRLR